MFLYFEVIRKSGKSTFIVLAGYQWTMDTRVPTKVCGSELILVVILHIFLFGKLTGTAEVMFRATKHLCMFALLL